jgi:four helix bundle protein
MTKKFLQQKGNYRNLIAYQKAECIYDVTYYFAHKYFEKGDRTIDQMIQSARSGKQNIAEGCSASTTSSETEIKLISVAKASLQELMLDYEDYLRVRGLELWAVDSEKAIQARNVCSAHNESEFYRNAILTTINKMFALNGVDTQLILKALDFNLTDEEDKVTTPMINKIGYDTIKKNNDIE